MNPSKSKEKKEKRTTQGSREIMIKMMAHGHILPLEHQRSRQKTFLAPGKFSNTFPFPFLLLLI